MGGVFQKPRWFWWHHKKIMRKRWGKINNFFVREREELVGFSKSSSISTRLRGKFFIPSIQVVILFLLVSEWSLSHTLHLRFWEVLRVCGEREREQLKRNNENKNKRWVLDFWGFLFQSPFFSPGFSYSSYLAPATASVSFPSLLPHLISFVPIVVWVLSTANGITSERSDLNFFFFWVLLWVYEKGGSIIRVCVFLWSILI